MFGNKNLSASDSPRSIRAEDAVFIGWQPNSVGEVFPLFTITASGHPLYGSTVSDKTLRALNLQIPQTPPFKYRCKILNRQKRKNHHALNYRRCSDYLVAPGSSHFLHHERVHSHSTGDRSCGRLAQNYSRTKCDLIRGKSSPEFSVNVNLDVS